MRFSSSSSGLQSRLRSFLSEKNFDVAELIDSSALPRVYVDIAKSLIIDQTHPVLANGKVVLLVLPQGCRNKIAFIFEQLYFQVSIYALGILAT